MKNIRILLCAVAVFSVAHFAGAQLPVRYWDDDMPRHTFSVGLGPGWTGKNNPLFEGLDSAPLGVEVTLRYDWGYFRGYEVSLGTGLTYVFSRYSSRLNDISLPGEVRVGETFHYVGANALNTKMWLGKRTVWDVCIHMGYMGGSSWAKANHRDKITEHGFMAGVSTGMDFLITAWFGVGVHFNVVTGVLYPSGGGDSRDSTRGSIRVGAVYCF